MSKKRTPTAPKTNGGLEKQLRESVKTAIQQVTPSTYPAVSARLTDVAGYKQVEEDVIRVMLKNVVTAGSALALLESEWGGIV